MTKTKVPTVEPDQMLTTSHLAATRGISSVAVRAASDRGGAPKPDIRGTGRGVTWRWNPNRPDVRAYLMDPATLAVYAWKVYEQEGSVNGAARKVGVDRQTFLRIRNADGWATFRVSLAVLKAAGGIS